MSSILVVGQENRSMEQIHQALSADGWRVRLVQGRVQALQAAASEAPDLVLISAEVPGAEALAKSFSRGAGGPGVVVLMPERPGGRSIQADARLSRPFSDQDVLEAVRKVQAAPRQTPAASPAQSQVRLTSQEIFGDVLAEVEGLPRSAPQSAPPAPGEDSAGRSPSGIAAQAGGAHRGPAGGGDDIQRKLEKTLSGVFGPSRASGGPPAGSATGDAAARADAMGAEIDALLSKTLSKLDLPTRHKPAAGATASHPAVPAAAPAAVPTPPPSQGLAKDAPQAARSASPSSASASSPPASGASAPAAAQAAGPSSAASSPPAALEGSGVHRPRPSGQVDLSEIEDLARTRRKSDPGRPAAAPPPARRSAAAASTATGAAAGPAAKGGETRRLEQSPGQAAASFDGAATQRIEVLREEGGDQPGERFGQYTLLERIAVGGMAEVWKARMRGVEGFQKTVAIKKILPYMTDNTEFVAMFIDEAKLAAQLSHPNIIHIYDLGKIGRDYYIAMEYVEGKDLRSLLNAGRRAAVPLPQGLALLIATRLAGALDYAHHKRDFEGRELGLVHRDVSPQNVLLSFDGEVKLCDFGIAKAVSKASQTQLGALKGKLQYMSPEQAWGRHVDARSDIFSLGAVLFEMLTGERLFPGDTEMSVLEAVRQAKVRTPRQVDASIPPEVDEIVSRALATQPEDRFQSAGEMAQRLEAVLHARRPLPGPAELAAYIRAAAQAPGAPESQEAPAAAERGSRPSLAPPLAASPARDKTSPGAVPSPTPPPAPAIFPAAPTRPPGVASGSSPGLKTPAPAQESAAAEIAAVPPLAPLVEVPAEEHRGRLLLIAAILLLAVVAVASFFVFGRRKGAGGAPPASAAGVSAPGPATPAGQSTGAAAISANPGAAPGAARPADQGTGKAGTPAAASGPAAAGTPAGGKVDVQGLVGQEIAKRAEAMKQKLEEQQKQLQKQIDQAKATAKTPPEPPGRPPAEPARSAAAPPPSTPAAPEPRVEPARPAAEAATPPAAQQAAAPASGSAAPPAGAADGAEAGKPVAGSEPPRAALKVGDLVPMGPGVTPPKLVSVSKPEYPPLARIQRVEGVVIVNVLVDESGRVADVRLLEPIKERVGINEVALAVARSARYTPASKEGVRVKMWARLKIPFKL